MIQDCLFPVAGQGTRFLPVTKSIPKEMLPILSKPLMQYALEEAVSCDLKDLTLVSNKDKFSIESYLTKTNNEKLLCKLGDNKHFQDLENLIKNSKIKITYQETPKGLGHAVMCAEKILGRKAFAVILPDDLCYSSGKSVTQQLIDIFKLNPAKSIVAVEEVDLDQINKYGVISFKMRHQNNEDIFLLDGLIEKPNPSDAPSNLAVIGRYILTPEIFDKLKLVKPDKNNEIQLTSALNMLANEGKVVAYKFSGKRLDCGSIDGFVEATNFFYEIK